MLKKMLAVLLLSLGAAFSQVPSVSITLVPRTAKTLFGPPEDIISLSAVRQGTDGIYFLVENSTAQFIVYQKKSPQLFEQALRIAQEPQIQIIHTVGTAELKASYRKYIFYLNGNEIIGLGYTTKVETITP